MQRYILGRLLQMVISLIGVTLFIFVMSRLSGDPVLLVMGPEVSANWEETYREVEKQLGLDKPLYVQYFVFLANVAKGNFGESWKFHQPALSLVLERLPATIELSAAAMLVASILGIPLGVLTAVKRDTFYDRAGKTLALLGQSMPVFWVGIILILIFAVALGVLPVYGRGEFKQLILPAVTLGLFPVAAITRLTRSSMLNVLDCEYVKMARIKGVSEAVVIWKHSLRNAAMPVLTYMGIQFGLLLAGAVLTEMVFAWPGVGRLAVEAVMGRDFPVIQASVFVATALFITLNLVVDILYAYVDPRIRY